MTKTINPPSQKVPVRLRFTLRLALLETGKITLSLNSDYAYNTGTSMVGYIRRYNSLWYTNTEAWDTSYSGHTVTIEPGFQLDPDVEYELVLETWDTNNPHFKIPSTLNQKMVAAFTNGVLTFNKEQVQIFPYKEIPYIDVKAFYMTTILEDDLTVLVITAYANEAIAGFPKTLIELEITSSSPFLTTDRVFKCGIVSVPKRTETATLQCILTPSSPPRIRIEGFNTIPALTTFHIMLYDLVNPVIADDFVKSLDAKFIVTDLDGGQTQSQAKLTRLYTRVLGTSPMPERPVLFPTSSSNIFDTLTTLSRPIMWETGDDCNGANCRFVIKGPKTGWLFNKDMDFLIGSINQNALVDEVNDIIGKTFSFFSSFLTI